MNDDQCFFPSQLGDQDPEGIGDVFFDDTYDMMVEEDEEDDDDEDETESSIELFIRFLQSMFKKLSKRLKKASRSMLPAVISPQLVNFIVLPTFLISCSVTMANHLLGLVAQFYCCQYGCRIEIEQCT